MKRIHMFAVATALLLVGVNVAQAQKMKPMAMPATSKAHMSKADKDAMKNAHSAAKAERKADERVEKDAKDALKDQPKELLKDIKLSKEEKASVKAIEKRAAEQVKALEKQEKAAEKAGTPMADVAQKINALREQERIDLRAALTPEHQARFDANVRALKVKH